MSLATAHAPSSQGGTPGGPIGGPSSFYNNPANPPTGPAATALANPNASYPSVARDDRAFPHDGMTRSFTHETAYEEQLEIANRVWIAFFDMPTPLVQLFLPAFAYDGEKFTWRDFVGHIRPAPEYAYQAPLETVWLRQAKQTFQMYWFGLMFTIDNSIRDTPIEDFIVSAYTRLIQGCMNLTVYIFVMRTVLAVPSMIRRAYEVSQNTVTHNAARTVEESIRDMLAMEDKVIFAFDRTDLVGDGVTEFVETARQMLYCTRVSDTIEPNLMLISESIKRYLTQHPLYVANADVQPQMNQESIQRSLRLYARQDDLLWTLNPSMISTFQGLNIITGKPYKTHRGIDDLLLNEFTFGLVSYIDTWASPRWWRIDIENRCWTKVWALYEEYDPANELVKKAGGLFKVMTYCANRKKKADAADVVDGGHGVEDDDGDEDADIEDADMQAAVKALKAVPVTRYNTAAVCMLPCSKGFILHHANKHTRYVACIQPRITVNTYTSLVAHGGRDTGCTVFGRKTRQEYKVEQVDRREYKFTFRMGACVGAPGNIAVSPHTKLQKYCYGGNAIVYEPPTNLCLSLKTGFLVDKNGNAETSKLPPGLSYYVPTWMGNNLKEPGHFNDAVTAANNGNGTSVAFRPVENTYYLGRWFQNKKLHGQMQAADVYNIYVPVDEYVGDVSNLLNGSRCCIGGVFEDADGAEFFPRAHSKTTFIDYNLQTRYRQNLLKKIIVKGVGQPDESFFRVARPHMCTSFRTDDPIRNYDAHGINGTPNSKAFHVKSQYDHPTESRRVELPGYGPFDGIVDTRFLDRIQGNPMQKTSAIARAITELRS